MMPTVELHEAKTQLSKLIEAAEAGEDVVIARAGMSVVRLVPVKQARRKLGLMQGRFKVPEDFDASLDERVLALFEGR